jgi:hypothetical protein
LIGKLLKKVIWSSSSLCKNKLILTIYKSSRKITRKNNNKSWRREESRTWCMWSTSKIRWTRCQGPLLKRESPLLNNDMI